MVGRIPKKSRRRLDKGLLIDGTHSCFSQVPPSLLWSSAPPRPTLLLLFHPLTAGWLALLAYLSWKFLLRNRADNPVMNRAEFAVFCALLAASWALKFIVGPTYY